MSRPPERSCKLPTRIGSAAKARELKTPTPAVAAAVCRNCLRLTLMLELPLPAQAVDQTAADVEATFAALRSARRSQLALRTPFLPFSGGAAKPSPEAARSSAASRESDERALSIDLRRRIAAPELFSQPSTLPTGGGPRLSEAATT